jgi:hypothetical protein
MTIAAMMFVRFVAPSAYAETCKLIYIPPIVFKTVHEEHFTIRIETKLLKSDFRLTSTTESSV